jgi:hypothetical protein
MLFRRDLQDQPPLRLAPEDRAEVASIKLSEVACDVLGTATAWGAAERTRLLQVSLSFLIGVENCVSLPEVEPPANIVCR